MFKKAVFLSLALILSSTCSFAAMNIIKTVNRQNASLAANLTYTINYENTGPGDLTGVMIWDTIPARSTYVSSSAGTLSAGVVTYNIGNLSAGASGSFTISTVVDSSLDTITANIRNVAFMQSNEEGVKETLPVFTTIVRSGDSDEYVTYGAWEDTGRKNMGFIHIYALADNTNVRLYYADDELPSTMTNPTSLNGATTYQAGNVIDFPDANPSFNYQTGDCTTSNGLNETATHNVNTRYFKLVSNKPILWLFDSIFDDLWSDSQIFLMSTDYTFSGSVFYTHLYYDRNPVNSSSHRLDTDYGDGIAVINPNNFIIGAYVYFSNDNGASWHYKVSSTVEADLGATGGIWYYGGVSETTEGDYKIVLRALDASGNDAGDARGIVWKGNIFAGKSKPCTGGAGGAACSQAERDADHDNNNAFFISKNGNKISEAGTDTMYGCVADTWDSAGTRGELVITNTGSVNANVTLYRYCWQCPPSVVVRDPVPQSSGVFGNKGQWIQWGVNQNIAAGTSLTLPYTSTTEYGAYFKIVLNSGGPIQAIGGANILAALYGQADYLEAADTKSAVGQDFWFGNSSYQATMSWPPNYDFWKENRGGILVALCPIAGTTVSITAGAMIDASTIPIDTANFNWPYAGTRGNTPITTTLNDQAIKMYSLNRNTTYRIQSSHPIYLMVQNLKGREKVFQGVVVGVEYFFPQGNLQKTASTSGAGVGDTVTYTLNFTNNGTGDAYNVIVSDTIPSGTSYAGASVPPTGSSGPLYWWQLASGASYIAKNGGSSSFDLYLQMNSPAGTCVTNTAIVHFTDSTGIPQAPKTSNESLVCIIPTSTFTETMTNTPTMTFTETFTPTVTATPTPPMPAFTLAKSVSPNPAKATDSVTYSISYRNNGSATATNANIWDTLPTKHIYVSSSGGAYNPATNIISFNIGNVAVGGQGSVSFVCRLDEEQINKGDKINNTAMMVCDERPTNPFTSNTTSLEVTVPDLQLDIVTNYPNPFADQTTIVYALSVKADVTIKFFTLAGELIRKQDGIKGRAGNNDFVWDDKNDYGQKASSGVYIIKIEAKTADESEFRFGKLAIMR